MRCKSFCARPSKDLQVETTVINAVINNAPLLSTRTNTTYNLRAANIKMNLLKSSLLLLLSCGSVQSFTASSSSLASLKRTTSKTVDLARPTTTSKPSTSTSLAVGTEIVEPSYNLALGSLALGAAFGVPGSPLKSKLSAFLGGIPLTLFGLFLAFQTTTLR